MGGDNLAAEMLPQRHQSVFIEIQQFRVIARAVRKAEARGLGRLRNIGTNESRKKNSKGVRGRNWAIGLQSFKRCDERSLREAHAVGFPGGDANRKTSFFQGARHWP